MAAAFTLVISFLITVQDDCPTYSESENEVTAPTMSVLCSLCICALSPIVQQIITVIQKAKQINRVFFQNNRVIAEVYLKPTEESLK